MARHIGAALRLKPAQRRAGVGHGLGGGEGFGSDQKQGVFGLQAFEHASQLVPVHIRHKVKTLAWHHKVLQGQHRHLRAQVRAANANVHHNAWIHHLIKDVPTKAEFSKYEWQKDHQENKTGTKEAYSPNKYKLQTKADYESWRP